MKKIEAIIRKEKFSAVDSSLRKIGVVGLTYFEATGRGRLKGEEMTSARGTKAYQEEYIERIKLEIIAKDSVVEKVVEAIIINATTDSVGDGKIFISSIEQIVDIGSGDKGDKAV